MAQSGAATPSNPSEPPRLMWPRPRLAEELEDQISTGEFLAKVLAEFSDEPRPSPRTGRGLTDLDFILDDENNPEAWHERNCDILRSAFTTRGVLEDYDPGVMTAIDPRDARSYNRVRADEVAERLSWLKAFVGRLASYGELPGVCTDADQDSRDPGQTGHVFVVHGRDDHTKQLVARTLRQMTGAEPVILHEQPDGGRTIIEKFEHHATSAAAAVVILSPDDVGGLATENPNAIQLQPRARQNVVMELGWFWGKLGRGRVIALLVHDVEQPGDMSGVLYIPVDASGAWKMTLGRELRNAGIGTDLNNVL